MIYSSPISVASESCHGCAIATSAVSGMWLSNSEPLARPEFSRKLGQTLPHRIFEGAAAFPLKAAAAVTRRRGADGPEADSGAATKS